MGDNDLVIVGGGAAGGAVFGELLARDDGGTLHWIAARGNRGRGVAYATEDAQHLLNVRAGGMGLFGGHRDEFARFAARRGMARASDFLPRRTFGEFIEAQLDARIAQARRIGRRFVIHDDTARGIERRHAASQYTVHLHRGAPLRARAVVLAIGALPPQPLRNVSAATLDGGAYLLDPWNLDAAGSQPQRVLVIGTGLTAVDTLLSASARWPHAQLLAVSRHGQLPLAHLQLPSEPWLGQDRLNAALLSSQRVLPMLRQVRAALRDAPAGDWRSVIDGMRPVNARLWQTLSLTERRRFLRHLRWAWEASRHRSAPGSSQAIARLIDTGRLRVHAARVLGVDGAGPVTLTIRHRATSQRATLQADLVVQATGLDTAAAYTRDGLISQLVGSGLVQPDPLQLGIAALPDGRLVDAAGNAQPGFRAIGSLLRGSLWECTAMPEIRDAAHALADALAPIAAHSSRGTEN